MVTKVKINATLAYDGTINDFLSLIDIYDCHATGIFLQEPCGIRVQVTEIIQDPSLDTEDVKNSDEWDELILD